MKNLLLSLVLIIGLQTFAQTEKEAIKKETLLYFDMVEKNDSEGVINYMHPKVFESISKEQLKKGMDELLKNEQMKIEFLSTELFDISDTIEYEGSKYSLVDYANSMRMTFLSEKDKPIEEKEVFINFMKSSMDAQFGEENVKADAKSVSLMIYVKSNIYAVNSSEFDGWKFLSNDANMKTVIDTVIPITVQEQLLED